MPLAAFDASAAIPFQFQFPFPFPFPFGHDPRPQVRHATWKHRRHFSPLTRPRGWIASAHFINYSEIKRLTGT
jgi:hypothetical protein